jgi:CRISPR/Cas system-associated endonuclease Cas1
VDPANAIVNHAYRVLEGQCRQALAPEGFDLACGFLHVDQQYRNSLAYDLMESFRGIDVSPEEANLDRADSPVYS